MCGGDGDRDAGDGGGVGVRYPVVHPDPHREVHDLITRVDTDDDSDTPTTLTLTLTLQLVDNTWKVATPLDRSRHMRTLTAIAQVVVSAVAFAVASSVVLGALAVLASAGGNGAASTDGEGIDYGAMH